MAKTKAKVKVKPGKGGTGTKIAESKVTASTGKKGKKLFQTRAQITISPKRTRSGKPRT